LIFILVVLLFGAGIFAGNALRNIVTNAAWTMPFRDRLRLVSTTDHEYTSQYMLHDSLGWVFCDEPDILPMVYDLDDFFYDFGNNVAVFYMNLNTGYTYMHNPDRIFFGASLSKGIHALYVYKLAERGLIDMYAMHTFTAADYWGGTGILRFMPAGTNLTTRELLGHSIVYSCNIAFRMLVGLTSGASLSFSDFALEVGADTSLTRDIISQNTSARDMGLWFYAINGYLNSHSRYGHYFLHDLKNTAETSHHYFTRWEGSFGYGGDINVRLLQSDYPIARKYGWAPNAFHDASIVLAPSNYILVVLTNMDRGAHELFEEISCLFQAFNRRFVVR